MVLVRRLAVAFFIGGWTGKDKAQHAQAGALIVGPNRIVFRKEF